MIKLIKDSQVKISLIPNKLFILNPSNKKPKLFINNKSNSKYLLHNKSLIKNIHSDQILLLGIFFNFIL